MKKLILKKKYSNYLKMLLFLIIIVSLGNVTYRKYQEHILKKEMNTLIEQDFTKEDWSIETTTIGNYQRVEQSMKRYLKDYSDKVKKVAEIMYDEKLKSILSAENYQQDGPLFTNTLKYLTTTKEEFNQQMTDLMKLTNEETIELYMDKRLPLYYQNIYKNYLLKGSFNNQRNKNIKELKQSSEKMNQLLDQETEVINFLATCQSWTVKEDKIIFSREEDLTTYNSMINKIS